MKDQCPLFVDNVDNGNTADLNCEHEFVDDHHKQECSTVRSRNHKIKQVTFNYLILVIQICFIWTNIHNPQLQGGITGGLI